MLSREMEKFLAFVEDKVPSKRKKNKGSRQRKKEVPKFKVVEVNNIKNKFENKKNKGPLAGDGKFLRPEGISRSGSKDIEHVPPIDEKVDKVKNLFEGESSMVWILPGKVFMIRH